MTTLAKSSNTHRKHVEKVTGRKVIKEDILPDVPIFRVIITSAGQRYVSLGGRYNIRISNIKEGTINEIGERIEDKINNVKNERESFEEAKI